VRQDLITGMNMNKLSIGTLIFLVLYFNPDTSRLFGKAISFIIPSEEYSLIDTKQLLSSKLGKMEIDQLSNSTFPGFYEAFIGGELLYVAKDGKYIISGDILDIEGTAPINLTASSKERRDALRSPIRAKVISEIDKSDMVIFEAPQEKYAITVFTDVDCEYCRKLHKEIPRYNENGITVRYLAYPRAGIGSSSFAKMESIWCSGDRNSAMDDAKLRRVFGRATCESPISKQLNISKSFRLSGTPSIVLDNGNLIGGYLSADRLLKVLTNNS
jgi:thiol:disulfide interchange protein DsbC